MSRTRPVYLVCEGTRDGLDQRLLNLMVVQRVGARNVRVEAVNGDSGLGSVAAWIRDREPGVGTIILEDRNLRSSEEVERAWREAETRSSLSVRICWSRHEIENFLLIPHALVGALARLPDAHRSSAWPADIPSAEALLQCAARPLLVAHAARLCWWELRVLLNARGLGLPHTPSEPARFEAWRDALLRHASSIREENNRLWRHPELSDERITLRYDAALALVTAPGFLTSGRFLLDLGGHELMGGVARELGLEQRKLAERLLTELAHRHALDASILIPDDVTRLQGIVDRLATS